MTNKTQAQNLPLLQDADLDGKIVLLRVDHNVVKKGLIKDPFRIDATLGTLYNIVERGGRPILMTHVGRPKDKKTGRITIDDSGSIEAVARYLERKLQIKVATPQFPADEGRGIRELDVSVNWSIRDLLKRRVGAVYLPNTRWFEGEEGSAEERSRLGLQLAGLADVFVNDAFGSWQPHASTIEPAAHLPAFAGFLMQKEINNLARLLEPERPFTAVVAGAKFDTKIGPLKALYDKVDHLILGGVIYNAFLAAKYGLTIAGIEAEDVAAAQDLVALDREKGRIVELPVVVESDDPKNRLDGRFRPRALADLKKGDSLGYVLDIAPESFDHPAVIQALGQAETIFVNAVMGRTPDFFQGSVKMDQVIDANRQAAKFYGGGDTLQEFKNLSPGLYLSALDNAKYYFFTGGGAVLKVLEEGSPFGLKPVETLVKNGGRAPRE